MDLLEWKNTIKTLKKDTQRTGFRDLKAKTNKQKTRWTIYQTKICSKCKHKDTREIEVEFKTPQQITIFEGELLWTMYILDKLPRDYSKYHKCPAGQKFIENIKEVVA